MQTATRYTAEDYLAFDAASEQRHEFWEGDVRAMAGAEPEHNVLKSNIAGELRGATARTRLPRDDVGSAGRAR